MNPNKPKTNDKPKRLPRENIKVSDLKPGMVFNFHSTPNTKYVVMRDGSFRNLDKLSEDQIKRFGIAELINTTNLGGQQ